MNQTEVLVNEIINNGYRLTAARRTIVETLIECGGHITADALAALVHQRAPLIGRMTVYRTLDLFSKLGVIHPIYQGTGAASFILMTQGSHHHLICNRCHTTIEFEDCTAAELMQTLAERFRFQVSSHLFELHGLCEDCLAE